MTFMEAFSRGIVYLMIIAASVFVIQMTKPDIHYQAQGIVLPLTQEKPLRADKDDVAIYPFKPDHFKPLGLVHIEQHIVAPTTESREAVQDYAKKLAASVGANGLVITSFGYTSPDMVGKEGAMYVFRGVAILTRDNG